MPEDNWDSAARGSFLFDPEARCPSFHVVRCRYCLLAASICTSGLFAAHLVSERKGSGVFSDLSELH
jgi:hypothetical protein